MTASLPGGLLSWQDVPNPECVSNDSLTWLCFRITWSDGSYQFPTLEGLDSVLGSGVWKIWDFNQNL